MFGVWGEIIKNNPNVFNFQKLLLRPTGFWDFMEKKKIGNLCVSSLIHNTFQTLLRTLSQDHQQSLHNCSISQQPPGDVGAC